MSVASIAVELMLGGQKIEIKKGGALRLNRGGLTGAESPDYDVSTEEFSAMDGGQITAEHVPSRVIGLSFTVDKLADTEELRRRLIAFFGCRKTGELRITRSGVTRRIACRCGSAPVFTQPNIRTDRLSVSVSLLCTYPYFEDETETEIEFNAVDELMMFPLTFFPDAGTTTGMVAASNRMTVNNRGDIPVGAVFTITASGGSVTNPTLELDSESIKILTTLEEGDELVVDTRSGSKRVELNGVSKFIFERGSVFFEIPTGAHALSIGADSGEEYLRVVCRVRMAYNGV